MIPISTALRTHLSQQYQTVASLWRVAFADTSPLAGTVKGFTDHDQDITYDDGDGPITYLAQSGYVRSDIATGSKLEADNLEVSGALSSPSITIADLHAGVWDFAEIKFMVVNWKDLTMGHLLLRAGHIGEVTAERDSFKCELRGLMQAYSRVIGQTTSPQCRNNFCDRPAVPESHCTLNPATFTFNFTVSGVLADNQTFTSSDLTQPGPTGASAILSISQANPGHVVINPGLPNVANGGPVSIYGCTGMTQVNGNTLFRNPNSTGTAFDLGVDTSSYPAYTGGGHIVPLGGNTGYFDFGLVTWLTGNNAGLQMEVRSYTPGQVVLQLPMPYAIQAGDTGTILAGCDKSQSTCFARFNNMINFNGEPYLPGMDQILQVGKQ